MELLSSKEHYKEVKSIIKLVTGRIKSEPIYDEHRDTKMHSFNNYKDLIKINYSIISISGQERTRLRNKLRKKCPRPEKLVDFEQMFFSLIVKDSILAGIKPQELFDMKNLMFFEDTINAEDIELYSNESRLLIRKNNLHLFKQKLVKDTRYKEDEHSKNDLYKAFKSNLESICKSKPESLSKVSRSYDIDYLLFLAELGILNKEQLELVMEYLSCYVDTINDNLKDFMKNKLEELSGDESALVSNEDTDNSSTDNGFSSSDEDYSDTSSTDPGNQGDEYERLQSHLEGDDNEPLDQVDKTLSQIGEQLDQKKRDILESMRKVSKICLLIITSFNDEANLNNRHMNFEKDEEGNMIHSMEVEDATREYFFESKIMMKRIVNVIMKILSYLNENKQDGVSFFELTVADPDFYGSINRIFMSVLSIRNDPIVKSHERLENFMTPKENSIDVIIKAAHESYGGSRKTLVELYRNLINGQYINSEKDVETEKVFDPQNIYSIADNLKKLYVEYGKIKSDSAKVRLLRFQLTLLNFPSIILHIVHAVVDLYFQFNGEDNDKEGLRGDLERILKYGVLLFEGILIDNNFGQSVLFQKKTSYIFWNLVDYDPIKFLGIFENIFSKDSSIIFKNAYAFMMLFEKFKKIININLTGIEDESRESCEKMAVVYMINTIIEKVLINNADNSEERSFIAHLHEFYGKKMRDRIKLYFAGESSTEEDGTENFRFLTEKYKPILIGAKFRNIGENRKKILDIDNYDRIKAELHFSILKLFNETTENWKQFKMTTVPLDRKIFELLNPEVIREKINDDEDELAGDTRNFGDMIMTERGMEVAKPEAKIKTIKFNYLIKNCTKFITELLRLYCNENVFEFNEDIIKMSSSVKLNYSKELAIEVRDLMALGKKLRNSSYDKCAHDNQDFWLSGLLKIIYKFIKGVYYEISTVKYQECGIGQVLDGVMGNISKMCEDLEPAKDTIEKINKLINRYNEIVEKSKNNKNEKSGNLKKTRESKERILGDILASIEKVYLTMNRYDIIEEIDRETHDDLQDGHTKLFEHINIMGSPYMKKIKDDISKLKKSRDKYKQVGKRDVKKSTKNYDTIHPRSQNTIEISKQDTIPNVEQKEEMCPLLNYYIKTKEEFLKISSNNFFAVMDDGGDDGMDSQYYYTLLIKWILEVFYKKMKPQKIVINQMMNGELDDRDFDSHPDQNVNKILKEFDAYSWIQILDNLLVVKPKIRSIMFEKFFRESFSLKKKILEKSEGVGRTVSLNFLRDELEFRSLSGIKNIFMNAREMEKNDIPFVQKSSFNMIKESLIEMKDDKKGKDPNPSHHKNDDKLELKAAKVLRADVFIACIFETAFYLQRCIRSEVFNRSFSINMEYYISLSSMIKSLAERNYQNFKEFVGRLRKDHYQGESKMKRFMAKKQLRRSGNKQSHKRLIESDKKIVVKNYLDLYYRGLHLYSNVPDKFHQLVRKDRPHMFWYNIVTLDTLSEYFNGPCVYNQENCLSNFIKLFLFIKRINENPFNTFYKLQENIITLVQTLFEGESKLKCRIMIANLKPTEFYSMIVNHIRLIKEQYLDAKKKGLLEAKNEANRISSSSDDEPEGSEEEEEEDQGHKESKKVSKKKRRNDYINQVLQKAFKLDEDFRDHPIVEISMGLFIIMKTVSNSNSENNFSKFLSEKSIEMATDLDAVKHLELTQSDKSKIEYKNKLQVMHVLNPLNLRFPFRMRRWRRQQTDTKKKNHQQVLKDKKLKESEHQRRENLNFFLFINQITLSIEVLNNERKPCVVFFKKHPECTFLTKETKTKFLEECVIDDAPSKLLDLMQKYNSFKIEMSSNLELYEWLKSWSDFTNESTFKKCMYVTYIISIFINLNVLLGYRWGSEAADTDLRNFNCDEPFYLIIQILSWLLIFISGLFLSIWFVCKFKFAKKMADDYLKSQSDYKEEIHRKSLVYKIKKNFIYGFLLQPIPSMLLCHVSFALASLFLKNPIFDSLHLLLLFYLSQTTRYVVNSIVGQFDQVVVTFVIGVCVIYTFTIIHAMYFRTAWDDMTSGGLDMCQTLFGCFGYILDFGFRNGGGIADSFSTLAYTGYYGGNVFWWKIVVNMVFFILVSKFALDIIFGIIIDTFTEMRDSQQARTLDLRNNCFICNFERKDFEQSDKPFRFHREHHHNLWHYVYYIIYLEKKDFLDYNGIEYFVREKYDGNSTEWFPIGKTGYLTGDDDQGIEQIMKKLEDIQQQISKKKTNGKDETKKVNVVKQAGFMAAFKKTNTLDDSSINKKQEKQISKVFIQSKTISNLNKLGDMNEDQGDELVESSNLDGNNQMIINHFDIQINKKFVDFEKKMDENLMVINRRMNDYYGDNLARLNRIEDKLDVEIKLHY